MILIQVIPNGKTDAYKLLKDKVTHEAETWSWDNKPKTKLVHANIDGHIEIDSADGVIVARVFPKTKKYEYYLTEKFMGRLIAWFSSELIAINVQFVTDPPRKKTKKRAKGK